MFVKYPFIEENHKSTLETVIRQHAVVTEQFLAKLYSSAVAVFNSDKSPGVAGLIFSRLVTDKHVVASVTDEVTGIYLQLAAEKAASVNRQLTVGQKWAMQGKHVGLSTTATKMW
jgi:hypothetical protein